MNKRNWGGIVASTWLLTVAACGQELVLPTAKPDVETAGAPDDGFTGPTSGAGGVATKGRLPIADVPSFSSFGGDGGEGAIRAPGTFPAQAAGSGGEQTLDLPPVANGGVTDVGGEAGGVGGGDAAGGSDAGGSAGPPRLWFSEYVEGSGSYKALEIYAPSATSLEGCDLETYFNGKTEPARLTLHGALESGAVQVLCSTTLAQQVPAQCSRSTSLTFNGDDAIALRCAGTLLDVIGEIGVDPGTAWAEGATADHTLRRRCSVTAGNPLPQPGFEPDAEWQTFGVDTWSDLGHHCEP